MQANQRNIGEITCPFCLSSMAVHTNKNARFYTHCPACGPLNIHGRSFQDWVADRLGDSDPEPEPEPDAVQDDPEPEPEPDAVQDDAAGVAEFFDVFD